MSALKQKRWSILFMAITLLLVTQVAWWVTNFLGDIHLVTSLKTQNYELLSRTQPLPGGVHWKAQLENEAFHRRVMFISESVFFVFLTCVGLGLLFHFLRNEQRLREIQKNFIEIVTHESKTPLTALKLRLESLQEKRGPDAREVRLCLDEVRRLTSCFEKAMVFNRFERRAFTFELIPIAEILRETAHRMEPFLKAKGASLALELDKDVMVRVDAQAIQNSLQNLIENSVLYNDTEPKKVSIVLKSTPQRVSVAISDNGPGIDPEDAPHIFEQFYRGRGARRVPGTGLGLYLVHRVIELHHGTLRLLGPVDPGKGTHLLIELPAASV